MDKPLKGSISEVDVHPHQAPKDPEVIAMMKTKPMLQYLGALNWAIPRCAPHLLRHLQRLQSVASNFSPMHLDEAFKLGQRLYADRYMGITFHGPRSAWWETHDKPDDLMQPIIHVDANLGNQYDSNPQIGAVVMIAGGCIQGSSQRIKLPTRGGTKNYPKRTSRDSAQ